MSVLGAKKGHIVSQETRQKISRSLKGRHISPKTEFTTERMKGKNNPMYGIPSPLRGKHHTEEAKLKISKKLKGKPATNGSFKKGHKVPKEWREKISQKSNKGKSPIHKLVFHELYEVWTKPILERDNFTCQMCGSKKKS